MKNKSAPYYLTFIIFFTAQSALSGTYDNKHLICLKELDPKGEIFNPLMYFFEQKRVKSYSLDEKITNESILASEKQYLLRKKINTKYNQSGKNFIYWQEQGLSYILNKKKNILKIRRLDKDVESLLCKVHETKTDFLIEVAKWKKLVNLRKRYDKKKERQLPSNKR